MTVPLVSLAIGAVAAGWIGMPAVLGGSNWIGHFFEPVAGHPPVTATHGEEWMVMGISVASGAAAGMLLSWVLYVGNPGAAGVGLQGE